MGLPPPKDEDAEAQSQGSYGNMFDAEGILTSNDVQGKVA